MRESRLLRMVGFAVGALALGAASLAARQMWLDESLNAALRMGNVADMRALVKQGARDRPRPNSPNLLFWSASVSSPALLRDLLEAGADLRQKDAKGQTLLHAAQGREATRVLITAGADLDALTPEAATPLHLAIQAGDVDKTIALIEAGASHELSDAAGATPLHLAVSETNVSVAGGPGGSQTVALSDHWTRLRRRKIIAALLKAGGKLGVRDRSGATPLHVAARLGETELVQYLLARGADPSVRDGSGQAPRDLAAALPPDRRRPLMAMLSPHNAGPQGGVVPPSAPPEIR